MQCPCEDCKARLEDSSYRTARWMGVLCIIVGAIFMRTGCAQPINPDLQEEHATIGD